MRYFKLLIDDSKENEVFGHCENTPGFEQYDLSLGKFIKKWNDDIALYLILLKGID